MNSKITFSHLKTEKELNQIRGAEDPRALEQFQPWILSQVLQSTLSLIHCCQTFSELLF